MFVLIIQGEELLFGAPTSAIFLGEELWFIG